MKNELSIINYVLQRLSDCRDANDVRVISAELRTAVTAIEAVPYYDADKIIDAIFGSVEVEEDA